MHMRALHVTDLVSNVEVTAAFLQLFGLCKAVVNLLLWRVAWFASKVGRVMPEV
jgi:hypothetical protein